LVKQKSGEPRSEVVRQVPDGPYTLTVTVTRDRRLRTTVRWAVNQETIQVRAPARLPPDQLEELLDDIVARVLKQRARSRQRNDDELETRARDLNQRYFDGELRWHTIRWVSNMTQRLGSCTDGGTTDGDIRISDRIRDWPAYVVNYIIAHELTHRKHPNHSSDFWAYLSRYPHTERARGFVEGIAYAQGDDPDSLI
jgi:predicted metal-dependent hydrolase